MSEERTRRRCVVHGRVQGVFFRSATEDAARREGVAGWVANRADGTVEAVFEGPPEAVERMVRFCNVGPPAARVERVEASRETPEGLRGFVAR